MSRSRKRFFKSQYISGNDRPFKILGRRNLRTANRQLLRNLMAHKDMDVVSDEIHNIQRVTAMDPWAWPSDGTAYCYRGTEEKFLKECEDRWNNSQFVGNTYSSKKEYMEAMRREYRKGVNK